MKTVYLVRHGESVLNTPHADVMIDDQEAPLTDRGVEQTRVIAERAARLSFAALVASPWVRTRATAEAIAERTAKRIEYSDLFVERRMPRSLIGLVRASEEFRDRFAAWHTALFREGETFEDGENFAEIKARAFSALEYLQARSESEIVVVTHGFFLRVMLAAVIFGRSMTPGDLEKFITATRTANTGISVIAYGELAHYESADAAPRWQIRVYNDHAHLG